MDKSDATVSPVPNLLEITPADREVYLLVSGAITGDPTDAWVLAMVRKGKDDHQPAMQAIARHRLGCGETSYLIWSNEHCAWWRPEERGYTRSVELAGRYGRSEAIEIAGTVRGGWSTERNPSEIAIPEKDAIEQSCHPQRLEAYQHEFAKRSGE